MTETSISQPKDQVLQSSHGSIAHQLMLNAHANQIIQHPSFDGTSGGEVVLDLKASGDMSLSHSLQ